jgi:hypothetical protein
MVGLSSVLSGEGSSTHKVSTEDMLLGMGLIVASQVRGHRPLIGFKGLSVCGLRGRGQYRPYERGL